MSELLGFFENLSKYKDGVIYYYPNNGNAGDALLNMGFYELASKYNINYIEIKRDFVNEIKNNDILLIAGGGAMVPEWGATTELVKNLNKNTQLVILPQSIRGVDEVIKNLPEKTIVFCREKYSYEYCLKKSNAEKVYLENDIAFHCDVGKIQSLDKIKPNYSAKDYVRMFFLLTHSLKKRFTPKVYAMRVDKEKNSNLSVPRTLMNDFSLIANFGSGNFNESIYSANKFLEVINLYDEIHTDRLHVAIGACLLGKKVIVYNNGYYKCKGVYEQSMKNFPNVKFVE